MREQKNDEKGYFFRAGQCTALSSFRVGKNATFVGNVYVNFTSLLKRCNKGCLVVTGLQKKTAVLFLCILYQCNTQRLQKYWIVCVLIDNIGTGYVLNGHSEKGYQFPNVEQTV